MIILISKIRTERYNQKGVVCLSIILQSTNERCNYLQGVLGLFFHSTCVPEKVVETLAHSGLSISLTAIHQAVKSLSKEASIRLKSAVRSLQTAFAYDNFDIAFKTAQPTVEHHNSFVSATSATAIPLFNIVDRDALRCSNFLWERNPENPSDLSIPITFNVNDLLRELHEKSVSHRRLPNERLSPFLQTYAWHVRNILVTHHDRFAHFRDDNRKPVPLVEIPVHKTTQIPCRAMKIKESTLDGNMEVMEALLRQGGIGEP
ncbi:hypothetical protein BDZ97DRAFT_1664374, partial [Flammula alnicola]